MTNNVLARTVSFISIYAFETSILSNSNVYTLLSYSARKFIYENLWIVVSVIMENRPNDYYYVMQL